MNIAIIPARAASKGVIGKNTTTDVYTYLDNFVYDDTNYESVEQYISSDFKNTEDFRLHLIKNYFLNNSLYLFSLRTSKNTLARLSFLFSLIEIKLHRVKNLCIISFRSKIVYGSSIICCISI